uniref:Uncharacterized protein n=3 Tax=Hemiselmis andersenii TaxID=464988 RepID=A0A6U5AUR0_HEMAN|mmetsp:Transcript_49568/g.120237  ORF Transcript_49568/g.120237 Transcript_49568/m.120237 type:complete len:385 (+) Transcript_49568:177-1331(+)
MMGNMRGIALLLFICATCAIVSCDDSGLQPTELSQTLSRLQQQQWHTAQQRNAQQSASAAAARGGVRTTSDLAIPTSAYANAYADMRSPDPAAMPNPFANTDASAITGLKLSKLPSFALQQVATNGPQSAVGAGADLRTPRVSNPIKLGIPDALLKAVAPTQGAASDPRPTTQLLANTAPAADSVLRALAGRGPRPADARGGGGGGKPVGLAESGVSSAAAPKESALLVEKRKALAAMQHRPVAAAHLVSSGHTIALSVGGEEDRKGGALGRVAAKHRALQTNTHMGPRGDAQALRPAGEQQHGKSLDSSVKSYHGYLASAVMVLAGLAGTAICGGICAVSYCYMNREKGLSDVGEDGQRGEKKYYGRPTAQYGSYGSAMRRTV